MRRGALGLGSGIVLLAMLVVSRLSATSGEAAVATDPLIARGKYLVAYGGCNECHTSGWRESGGTLPVSRWMTGSPVGIRGSWGTSYPVNVRLRFAQISEEQWLFSVRTRGGHPPMQWHDIRFLTLEDQRALYRFIHSLGPAGQPMPGDAPPWREPKTPYIRLEPQTPAP